MMRCALILWLAWPGLAASGQSPEFSPQQLSAEGRAAYEVLLGMELFAVGGIGFGAQTSEGEEALRKLLEEPEAGAALESLVMRAPRAGGLYALLGLRLKGSDSVAGEARRFRERADERGPRRKTGDLRDLLEDRPGVVVSASGCLFYTIEWEKVLQRIEAGAYDLGFGRPAR